MKKIGLFIFLLVFAACDKEKVEDINCENFYEGCTTLNESIVKNEIEKLTVDLDPVPSPEDMLGHLANLNTLIDRLNNNCDNYEASQLCYACIETYPLQSEILIEFFSGEHVIIDIHTPEKDILRFAGVHR